MDSMNLNSKQKGNIGIGAAIAFFTKSGFNVSIPLTDSQSYDLVIEKDNEFKRVQVKYTSSKVPSGNYKVELRSVSGSTRKVYKTVDSTNTDLLFISTDDYNLLVDAKDVTKNQWILTQSVIEKYKV